MPLSKSEFSKLIQMQTLTNQLAEDNKELEAFLLRFNIMLARKAQLEALYSKDWLRIHEARALSKDQKQELEALVPDDLYSVLDEDTIWDVLQDFAAQHLVLLKRLASSL